MLERLRAALGADAVRPGADTGFRLQGRAPMAVIAPGDAEQAAVAIRICSENRLAVRPAGAGTWLHAGEHGHFDVILTTARLRGVVEYEPADLVAAVEAGTPLSALETAFRPHGQFFPVRPPAADGATLGGTIATASAGPLRLGHGTPRDHVLGIRLVTGDGRVLDLGGRVVKNVAGYDLVRPLVGSDGTLGLITRAFIRLRPRPARDITAVFHAGSADPLARAALRLHEGWPVAAELLDPDSARSLLPGADGWVLAVQWHGNASFADHMTRMLSAHEPRPVLLGPAEADAFWEGFGRLEEPATAAFRITGLMDRLPQLLDAAGRLMGHPDSLCTSASANPLRDSTGFRWRLAAHARSGIVRLWTDEASASEPGLLEARYVAVRQSLEPHAGVRALVLPSGPSGPDDVGRLVRGIRTAFDPAGVFRPGTAGQTAGVP